MTEDVRRPAEQEHRWRFEPTGWDWLMDRMTVIGGFTVLRWSIGEVDG